MCSFSVDVCFLTEVGMKGGSCQLPNPQPLRPPDAHAQADNAAPMGI